MNIHPQLFDRWKPLILESRRWRDHTGLSCKSASKMPGTLSAYGNGYGIMPGRAKLTKLTHPYPDIPPSRHGGATQSRFIAELIAFYGDLFAHKARLPSDGSSRECPRHRTGGIFDMPVRDPICGGASPLNSADAKNRAAD
jgi:hypothetical protein